MLHDCLSKLYNNFRLTHYKSLFGSIREKNGSLSATEAFAADVIYLLGNPTIKQFADCLGISQPNASYKINNLVAKGYVIRTQSDDDRRESRLQLSDKFYHYVGPGNDLIANAADKLSSRFSEEDIARFEEMLGVLISETE